jgi:hypothetical protein
VILNRFLWQIASFVSNNRGRLWLWILGSWFATVGVLWHFWPYQPRSRIDLLGSEIVGITSDSRELVTFSHAKPAGEAFDKSISPGSIHVWNLTSGQHRTVPVPRSTWRDDPNQTWFEIEERFLMSSFWSDRGSMHGQWFEFCILDGSGIRPIESRNAILSLSDNSIRFSDNGDSLLLSPKGGWFRRLNWSRVPVYAICETATGEERLTVQEHAMILGVQSRAPSRGCFSPDDLYFACAVDGPQGKSTRVWNMETGKVVLAIDKYVHAVEFSRSGRLMAGLIRKPDSGANSPSQVDAVIWDVESGNVVHRHQLSTSLNVYAHDRRPALKFMEDDTRLVCYDLQDSLGFGSFYKVGGPEKSHVLVNLHFAWNLASNPTVVEFNEDPMFDPNFKDFFEVLGPLPRSIASRDKTKNIVQLYDAASRRLVWSMPVGAEPMLLSPSGTKVVYERSRVSSMARLMDGAAKLGVPIPAFIRALAPSISPCWSIVDLPSGRTLATIPKQQYRRGWLSPDEKTWVTSAGMQFGSEVINVWDFPPRKPWLRPMVWALIAPTVLLLGWGVRRATIHYWKRLNSDSQGNRNASSVASAASHS